MNVGASLGTSSDRKGIVAMQPYATLNRPVHLNAYCSKQYYLWIHYTMGLCEAEVAPLLFMTLFVKSQMLLVIGLGDIPYF